MYTDPTIGLVVIDEWEQDDWKNALTGAQWERYIYNDANGQWWAVERTDGSSTWRLRRWHDTYGEVNVASHNTPHATDAIKWAASQIA